MVATVTGENVYVTIGSQLATLHAVSDFSLTFDRGTIEQELVGQEGNYFAQGALSIEGSLTCCRFGASGSDAFMDSLVDGSVMTISGTTYSGSNGIGFYFYSAQVTGYDVSIGDNSTISEASIDFTILDPYNAVYTRTSGWLVC